MARGKSVTLKNDYSVKIIAQLYGRSYSTTRRHIEQLVEDKKFIKHSLGKQYNNKELSKLSLLLGFSLGSDNAKLIKVDGGYRVEPLRKIK